MQKPDQWADFRRGVALLSLVLFFFCVVAVAFLAFRLVTVGTDVAPNWSELLGFASVAVPLGVAAGAGIGVYRAQSPGQAKRRGRIMGLAFMLAALLLVVTGVIGDRLS
ncbi:hypothetical protein AB0J86_05010 [Micromonospora sp. NPDC049559]|uniref:hypothetical protein n=1 Tax=Micromonospora sp. NPDC049559 TaxID=3155923 RepID=UPI00342FD14C